MPRGADAQPERIHYIFIFLRQRGIVRGSYVRSGFRCGRLTTLMSSNDLEGEHVSPGGYIGCRYWTSSCVFDPVFHRASKKKIATLDCELL
jgi:hypothetical protein